MPYHLTVVHVPAVLGRAAVTTSGTQCWTAVLHHITATTQVAVAAVTTAHPVRSLVFLRSLVAVSALGWDRGAAGCVLLSPELWVCLEGGDQRPIKAELAEEPVVGGSSSWKAARQQPCHPHDAAVKCI
jgi:hypothetical protein